MEAFDVIVVGGGSGLTLAHEASERDLKVALVEPGPMGGTCLNRGCIPSKMLIHSADVAETVKSSEKFGIKARLASVDFAGITGRVSRTVDRDAREIEEGIREDRNVTLFKTEGRFVGKRRMKAGSGTISGERVFIMAGTRPLVPPIPGLEGSGFLTSREALRLKKQPKVITIIGGGYIAAELAHFFGSLGTKVNILQRDRLLVNREDPEIADTFTRIFSRKHNVMLGYTAEKVEKKSGKYTVTASSGNSKKRVTSDQLLLAVGRVPNSDVLEVARAGIKTDKRGYIRTNDYLETTAKKVWAGGDIAGKYLFKHSANLEAQYMQNNAFHPSKKRRVNYFPMPHAIFSSPQIAGVGATEAELKPGTYEVGKYEYRHTGMGAALRDSSGFAKILVEKGTRKILGCHIIGPEASTMIHEAIIAMRTGRGTINNITGSIHVHPAMPEVLQRAATRLL